MYSKRSPPTVPAGIEFPNISMPGRCGIAPSTGINRSRKYSSILEMARVFVIEKFATEICGVLGSQLHREHHAELRLAAHHPSICFISLFERIGFNHGTHTTEYAEIQSIFRSGRRSRSPSLDRLAAKNQL